MGKCSDGYNRATGKPWKTTGNDVQYFIESEVNGKTKDVYLYYQCTTTDIDWKYNADFIPKRVKLQDNSHIWVFRGLWKAFMTAWDTIFQEVERELNVEGYKTNLHIAGHSYGGAMTVYSVISFNRQRNHYPHLENTDVFFETFGAPKVLLGRKSEAKLHYLSEGTNYLAHNDLVARMPPFYVRYKTNHYVGDKFNLIKMLSKVEHYHTCYGEVED